MKPSDIRCSDIGSDVGLEAPYFAEYFLVGEDEEEEHEEKAPKNDYWVYDAHRGKLQRHHVQWRKTLFNPSAAEGVRYP